MISVHKFTFNPFQENTYILSDETNECVIIDPGCYTDPEKEALREYINVNELNPVRLISTHSHIDHVLGNKFVAETFDLNLEVHEKDLETFLSVPTYAGNYGFTEYESCKIPTSFIKEGDKITFGNSEVDVIFVPGHAPGHIAFVAKEEKFVINGDCLFYNSIGRTDLPGGDLNTLISSIKNKLFTLPDDYTVYCGHGPETTIGFEKETNPHIK